MKGKKLIIDLDEKRKPRARRVKKIKSMLDKTDSLNILNEMEVKYANKFSVAFKKLTGKNIEDVSFHDVVNFYKENWFRLQKVGTKTLISFEDAVYVVSGSHCI